MAEEYIIGSNAQFNDSVEILKDLTLYGVVENTTDFAVKIQGDEKLRITSDGVLIGDTISHIGDIDTKIRFPENDVISFETTGSERLRINSTGAVGIGTNDPYNVGLDVRFPLTTVATFSSLANGTQGANVSIVHTKSAITDNDKVGQISFSGGGLGNATTYSQIRTIATDISNKKGDIAFYTRNGNNTTGSLIDDERLRITSGGVVNIGVNASSNPFTYLRFGASQYGAADIRPTDESSHKVGLAFYTDGTQDTTINPTEQLRITSSGNLQFNSGFGSVQTAYGVRAWALFNGETPTLLDDGNIAGFTDEGVGTYTFTFDNNMPDSNYVITGSTGRNAKPHFSLNSNVRSAGNFRVSTGSWGSNYEAIDVDSVMFCVIC